MGGGGNYCGRGLGYVGAPTKRRGGDGGSKSERNESHRAPMDKLIPHRGRGS